MRSGQSRVPYAVIYALLTVAGLCPVVDAAEALGSAGAEAKDKVDFARDVRPIFESHCLKCHGTDRQESDFRLDRSADALRGGAGGVDIVSGKSADSPLVERISGVDAEIRMPPEGNLLPKEAVAVIRTWIDQGAPWPDEVSAEDEAKSKLDWWSLYPLVEPAVPAIAETATIKNEIDAFIRARLASAGLAPAPEADRRTLLRRVTFDLTGLQPTPAELAAFEADTSPDAYERIVDRLLASPRYGERLARHWIDVVHFAETHGNDQDRPRPNAWPYRDYLIKAFNDDKSYSRFVAEQVAGDVLFPEDPQATVALGMLAAGSWDESSQQSIQDDTVDKKIAQVLDRDDMVATVMSSFTSSTVHCARCHNHKFDAISQADYYSLQAVLAGVDRADRTFDADPAVHARRQSLNRRRRQVNAMAAEQLLADSTVRSELPAWELHLRERHASWQVLAPVSVVSAEDSVGTIQPDHSVLFSGPLPEKDTYTITFESDLQGITAIQLQLLIDPSLPLKGPGRQGNGNMHLSEFKLLAAPAEGGEPVRVPIASAVADFNQDGWGVEAAIDGNRRTAWGIYPEVSKEHSATFVLQEPLKNAGRVRLTVMLEQRHGGGHLIGRPRLAVTTSDEPAKARVVPPEIDDILANPLSDRSTDQQAVLARYLVNLELDKVVAELPAPQEVYAATSDFVPDGSFRPAVKPRMVEVLRRGDINQPLQKADPGALSCISGLESRFKIEDDAPEGERRAALAKWLVDRQNVLTWRSIVNRVWHYHFQRGIVDTPNDLGHMGGQPSHPELLDWLAIKFRDEGGSLKKLHRLMVTSATYRQSSQIDLDYAQIDAENRLLWRMNRTRLDAECIHDAVLQVSGKLDVTMGGPSVKQFVQTPGHHVTPNVDYLSFDIDDPGNFRRSVYRFLFRTLPDPFMETLDCPDGAQLTPNRSGSVGALQALAMLNDRFIVRQSEHAATRLTQTASTLPDQIRQLFQWALLREPTPSESEKWEAYAGRYGLANTCRMMFNTNEFIFVH